MTRFVDQATLFVQAGRGGKGCRSYHKDQWSRYPTPDGGDGGRGGHVIIRANPQQTTLLDFQTQRHFRGGHGGHASSNKRHGAQGKNCLLEVPIGTLIRDQMTGDLVREMLEPGEEVVVARGGAGGVGNAAREKTRFPSAAGPRHGQRFDPERLEGAPGEERRLKLELKLVADVGIIGMPNAGKSTLIGRISQARPKVAAFPFTTLHPVLGAVELPDGRPIVAVDVPGLIEGAHQGKGLGLDFLRHIERTRLLVHLMDMAGVDGRDPVADYKGMRGELKAYRKEVAEKPVILVANKMDLPASKKNLTRFRKETKTRPLAISAQTGEGVPELLEKMMQKLEGMSSRARKGERSRSKDEISRPAASK